MSPTFFSSVINSYLSEPHASLLNGILFGIPIRSSKLFYEQLQQVGLLHLVVLSGMNITIIGSVVGSIFYFVPKKMNLIITIICIVCFTFFVGPKPPIVRAAIMGSLTLIAILYGKKSAALISLLISIMVIAVVKPDWITGVSMQLSVGATLGIILFGKNISGSYTGFKQMAHMIEENLRISFAAQIFTVPVIFFYFKQISFISPLSNLAVSPLIAPLMMFGFLTSVLGKINYVLGLPTAYICYGLLQYIVWIIEKLAKIPGVFLRF